MLNDQLLRQLASFELQALEVLVGDSVAQAKTRQQTVFVGDVIVVVLIVVVAKQKSV